ncbi:hypothetical protein FUAX_44850 (plasmid) [Fulvitalea axinellae]|uniref:Uncharacterized protein n=1 Tax=Fulvitalea axinellae TaxID=1182444 RepID=A0AAU9D7R0_9BACT|nr:hypothetical protein FUAX_44850 [Fulvitalea axinellae]
MPTEANHIAKFLGGAMDVGLTRHLPANLKAQPRYAESAVILPALKHPPCHRLLPVGGQEPTPEQAAFRLDILRTVGAMFIKARRTLGLKLEWVDNPTEATARAEDILSLLQLRRYHLRAQELHTLFDFALMGHYGKVYDINQSTVADWIGQYLVCPERKEAQRLHLQASEEEEYRQRKAKQRALRDTTYTELRISFIRIINHWKTDLADPGEALRPEQIPNIPTDPKTQAPQIEAWWRRVWYGRFLDADLIKWPHQQKVRTYNQIKAQNPRHPDPKTLYWRHAMKHHIAQILNTQPNPETYLQKHGI